MHQRYDWRDASAEHLKLPETTSDSQIATRGHRDTDALTGKMASLSLEDFSTTGVITLLACWQMANFAKAVGAARKQYKITPPATDGDPNFVRIFRAQQNCVEFFGVFLGILWVASMFTHQYPASIFGALYLFGRQKYFYGYAEEGKKRLGGFQICVIALQGLLVVALIGLLNTLAKQYMDYDILGRYMMKEHVL